MHPRLPFVLGFFLLLGSLFLASIASAEGPPQFLLQWGSLGTGNGQFSGAASIATDPAGNVYVVDSNIYRIQKFTGTGVYITQWGSFGSGDGQFDLFYGVATDGAGNVYVADTNNNRIQKFTGTGVYITQWGSFGAGNGQFNNPHAVATDGAGNVYVADYENHRIQKFTGTGTYLTQWGSFGSGDGQLDRPQAVATDAAGNVYVADYGNNRVQKFTGTGTYLTQWGSLGSGDGQLDLPSGVATDGAGNVYVADYGNHRVQKFTGTGTYLTQWGLLGDGDGQFNHPRAAATDGAGNIFVVEYGLNNRVQKFAPAVPQVGSVAGRVTADCPAVGTPLLGVTVDAFKVGSGDLVGTAITDGSGNYLIGNLSVGQYTVTVVTPLDYSAAISELSLAVTSGQTTTGDFSPHCLTVARNQQSMGFWKHQVGVATGGKGAGQVSPTTLCSYLDLIAAHFNGNAINQVIVYQPPASAVCADKLQVARVLLDLQGSVAMIARARQQLMSLLLNVAAGYIGQTRVISTDGATVSQAITYCDNLIDSPTGNYEQAKTIADDINNGKMVPTGMIPLSTAQIAYRRGMEALSFRATPNPGSAMREFRFMTGARGAVSLALYDVSGRLVAELWRGNMDAGAHSVHWSGRTSSGVAAARGLYLARLQTPRESPTIKVLQLTAGR